MTPRCRWPWLPTSLATRGQSRTHTESDLRCFLAWCHDHDLHPLHPQRPHLELYLRWMQEIRGFQPSTVSRRLAVVAGFYRTCVIDSVLDHSQAEYVRRPYVLTESPTLVSACDSCRTWSGNFGT
jgi:integrase/recombinase XerD